MKHIFPKNYSLLLAGPPGVGKYEFCLDLAYHYLSSNEPVIYITTEHSPAEIEERAAHLGMDLSAFDSLHYVDIYSWSLSKKEKAERKNVQRIENPENLNEVILRVEELMAKHRKQVRIVFHSVSPLFLHNEERDVIKFIQVLNSRVKDGKNFIIYALQEGVHAPSTISTLRYFVDGTLEMRFYEEGYNVVTQIRALHLRDISFSPEWKNVYITEKGVKIE